MTTILNIAENACALAHPHNEIGWCVKSPPRAFTSQKSPHRIFFDSNRHIQLHVPFPYNWNVLTGSHWSMVISTACTHLLSLLCISNDRGVAFYVRRSVAAGIKPQRAQG